MRIVICLLVVMIAVSPAALATREATVTPTPEAKWSRFFREFDITFWQTAPFAVFWGYVARTQFFPQSQDWNPVISSALVISLANAYLHAKDEID